MSETYYIKCGRRYKAVAEYDYNLTSALPEGSHLVTVKPGCRSTVFNVPLANLPVLAVLEKHKDELCRVLMKASEMRPGKSVLTKEQAAAWDALRKALGDAVSTMHVDSANDIIGALYKAIAAEVSNG